MRMVVRAASFGSHHSALHQWGTAPEHRAKAASTVIDAFRAAVEVMRSFPANPLWVRDNASVSADSIAPRLNL
jgi:hypothetical protein